MRLGLGLSYKNSDEKYDEKVKTVAAREQFYREGFHAICDIFQKYSLLLVVRSE